MSTRAVAVVQEFNAPHYAGEMAGMFRQRARVFGEKLGWDVQIVDGQERDKYDDLAPVYLICTDESGHVTGSLRLLPTTGPTLLADVFADTAPDVVFSSPTIWECTRFVAEDELTARALISTLGDLCLKSGIESIVGNFDAMMLRVYSRIGCEVQILGKVTRGEGPTIYLGSFPITAEILNRVKSRMADKRVAA